MNFSNEIINWIKNLSKNYEIDFFDPMTHLDNCIKEIYYDEEKIILFMKDIGFWDDDFYVLNINDIKDVWVERNDLFCRIVKDGIELELIFIKSVVIHQDDPDYENKVLKIKEQKDCYGLDDNSLGEVVKEFEEIEVPKIKKIIDYYSLKYPQLSTKDLILKLVEKVDIPYIEIPTSPPTSN